MLFYLTSVLANKIELLVHSTPRNAPYIHPRLDSILELCPTFPNGFGSPIFLMVIFCIYCFLCLLHIFKGTLYYILSFKQTLRTLVRSSLSSYGWPRSLSYDFKIWPITFQGSGPSRPILYRCEKIHFNKNIFILCPGHTFTDHLAGSTTD